MKTIIQKNRALFCGILFCLLVCALNACGMQQNKNGREDNTKPDVETNLPVKTENQSLSGSEEMQTLQEYSGGEIMANIAAIQSFGSFQEFEENEKNRENGMTAYYVPALLGEKCRLTGISKREGVYLATSYQVFVETKHPDAVTAYEKETVGSIRCTQYLFSEPNGTIEMFQRNHFQEMRYGDRVLYYMEERSLRDSSVLLGYDVVFILDQTAFYIHLPAVNSLEEMLEYTELEKRLIE